MARTTNKLTATGIMKLKGGRRHGDGGGLWFNVSPTGGKSWVFRWTPKGGKPREMGLGPYPTITLAKARERAEQFRRWIADGLDPKLQGNSDIGKTFGEVADQYLEEMQSRWTNEKTHWQWVNTLTNTVKAIRSRQITSIETSDILRILKPIWTKTPETASRARMRIEAVLDYARARNWRESENPARWKGHLEHLLTKRDKRQVRHHPAMPYSDLPEFYLHLQKQEGLAARALELTILSATRTSETLKATWQEFNLENGLWIVSADRMKVKSEHRIPLSSPALRLLSQLHVLRTSDWVFPGQARGKPLSSMAMEMLLRRMKVKQFTVHGFRSTFRDWCGDETAFPREVAEAALAHKVGSDVERSYRRGDALEKRRELMESWARHCFNKQPENVIPITRLSKDG